MLVPSSAVVMAAPVLFLLLVNVTGPTLLCATFLYIKLFKSYSLKISPHYSIYFDLCDYHQLLKLLFDENWYYENGNMSVSIKQQF
jgi:hypothetical protein